jgi:hypothetical protein
MHSIIVYFVEALVLFYHMLKVLYYEQTQSEMRCFVLSHTEGVVIACSHVCKAWHEFSVRLTGYCKTLYFGFGFLGCFQKATVLDKNSWGLHSSNPSEKDATN